MRRQHNSTLRRALEVQELVEAMYEEGRQDRCKLWVYRHHVAGQLGISERTYWRYLRTKFTKPPQAPSNAPRQLRLFE